MDQQEKSGVPLVAHEKFSEAREVEVSFSPTLSLFSVFVLKLIRTSGRL